jgi:transposase
VEVLKHHSKEASVGEVTTIGLDLANSIFQAHGADAAGGVVFRKKLRRDQMLGFFAGQPRCLVAMEACSGAHHWARELAALGHEVRLIPPSYVKPFVKRQKNDMADAEAICEAAQRPTMRFVTPKTAEAQGAAVIFRTRDLLVRQRTQLSNALRGHLADIPGQSQRPLLAQHGSLSGETVERGARGPQLGWQCANLTFSVSRRSPGTPAV